MTEQYGLSLGKLLELTLAGREPAEKIQVTSSGIRLQWLSEGALLVKPSNGTDAGVDLLLSAGIHGNETAPIEMLDRLLKRIARGEIKPRVRILFLLGNPEAMRRNVRFVEQDMNRLFNGKHVLTSGFEAQRADQLERLVAQFFSEPDSGSTALRSAYGDPWFRYRAFCAVSLERGARALAGRDGQARSRRY